MSEDFRDPKPDRIISSDPEVPKLIEGVLLQKFVEEIDHPTMIEGERPKSPEERVFTQEIISMVEKYLRAEGITPRLIFPERIKFLEPLPLSPEQTEALVGTTNENQAIRIYSGVNDFDSIAHTLTHELVHAHSFMSTEAEVEVVDGLGITGTSIRRFGLQMQDSKNMSKAFHYLNEAMVEEIALDIARIEFPHNRVTASIVLNKEASYVKPRQKMMALLQVLWERNTNVLSSKTELMRLLQDALFTGKILEFSRLIEKTFGKGSFRELGERFREPDPKIDDILARTQPNTI